MIKINDELKALIPPLTTKEYQTLEQNILNEGCRDALIVWNDTIVDGHNRYAICQKHNLEFNVQDFEFKDLDAVKVWMINNQDGRRNLTDGWKYELSQTKKEILAKKGKENMKAGGGDKKSGVSNIDKPDIKTSKTRDQIASDLGWSTGKVAMADKVWKEAEPEVKEKIKSNDISFNQAYNDIKKQEKKETVKKKAQESRVDIEVSDNIKQGDSLEILNNLEEGCIDILLTDPPYGINYKSNRSEYKDSITSQGLQNDGKNEAFKLLDDTCKILEKKMAANSHLYFFCSFSVFADFKSIIEKYFTVKTPIVWDKGNKGSGDLENDWGNQVELIIYCVKGKKYLNNRRGNILQVPKVSSSKLVHPTQKPNDLIKQILDVSYVKGDFVVDPFMGSGSTIKVCNEMNAKCLGIEIEENMFNIANTFING